jgi:hypothetical protein
VFILDQNDNRVGLRLIAALRELVWAELPLLLRPYPSRSRAPSFKDRGVRNTSSQGPIVPAGLHKRLDLAAVNYGTLSNAMQLIPGTSPLSRVATFLGMVTSGTGAQCEQSGDPQGKLDFRKGTLVLGSVEQPKGATNALVLYDAEMNTLAQVGAIVILSCVRRYGSRYQA